MTQAEISALLGRPLTATEQANFAKYLMIAKEALFGAGSLLCIDIEQDSGDRTFSKREGMRTVYTGIFSQLNSVTVDGKLVEADAYFWDNRNSKFYNSIVLKVNTGKEVVVNAEWGFDCIPMDLQALIAGYFSIASTTKVNKDVKSKKIEDFSVTYGDLSDAQLFAKDNAGTIKKYALCDVGYLRSGKVCRTCRLVGCGCQ